MLIFHVSKNVIAITAGMSIHMLLTLYKPETDTIHTHTHDGCNDTLTKIKNKHLHYVSMQHWHCSSFILHLNKAPDTPTANHRPRFKSPRPSERDCLLWCKEKSHPATGAQRKGLILCNGLTLVVLHNCDHRQWSAASEHHPHPLHPPTHTPPISSVIILLAWLHDQTGCWHLQRCSSDHLMPSDAETRASGNTRACSQGQEPRHWFHNGRMIVSLCPTGGIISGILFCKNWHLAVERTGCCCIFAVLYLNWWF